MIASFYKMVHLDNYFDMPEFIRKKCLELKIEGTINLSIEGINATIFSYNNNNEITKFFDFLALDNRFENINFHKTHNKKSPFQKLVINLKPEIVKLGINNININNLDRGNYISSDQWDEFTQSDDVILIDTRNDYETSMGSFNGAVLPETENFCDFPEWFSNWSNKNKINKTQKIAMCCTGGIRCEKSTAYLKNIGFDNTYHLQGGILKYLEDNKNKSNNWHGNCFVFDDRVAVDKNLDSITYINCNKCHKDTEVARSQSITKGIVLCDNCKD
ncbi:MAG: rhodanese-like domain-containing protein [Anaplasmataceae bacterium]|nr:rhodanese-like domain-containing protein [Anaplasmataceae bacterium]